MDYRHRWDPCVAHYDDEIDRLMGVHFARPGRLVFLIAGAGFDPRSCVVADRLAVGGIRRRALLVRETRPNPRPDQSARADAHTNRLLEKIPCSEVESVDIFGPDNAVVGGRKVVDAINRQNLRDVTDIVIDMSALSAGIVFPIIRYFVGRCAKRIGSPNLHVMVVHDPVIDNNIFSVPGDQVGYIHGFKGSSTLSELGDAARLWLPQLAPRMQTSLEHLHNFVAPHDICPILPFPSFDPRLGDRLAEEYVIELEETWEVDTRSIVYADEGDPLDLYRTILALDDSRRPVFAETGGSMLVLSPLGSKVMALGSLMAALERDIPVAYVEPVGYEFDGYDMHNPVFSTVHLWLEGEVYPEERSGLLW